MRSEMLGEFGLKGLARLDRNAVVNDFPLNLRCWLFILHWCFAKCIASENTQPNNQQSVHRPHYKTLL